MFTPSPLPRTLAAAMRDVEHKKLEVRLSAVRDLGRLAAAPDEQAIATLLRTLSSDPSPTVRAEAAMALADAGAKPAIEGLLGARRDEHPRVRQMAVLALGEVASESDQEACRAIEQTLSSDEPELRFQALVALHHAAPERAQPAVLEALDDEDAHIRYVALRILEERWVEERAPAAPEHVLERARDALEDADSAVRLAAAILLARAGDRSGSDVIVAAIDTGIGARELEDAQTAIELSGELGLTAARRGLERRAWGLFGMSRDPFAWQARVALARLGDARARRGIIRGLSAWTRDARTLAVAAAGRARLEEARSALEAMRGDGARADPDAVEEALAQLGPGTRQVQPRSR